MERGTPEERREFAALSAKVSGKSASEPERARWRELRTKLAGPPPPPPPGRTPPSAQRKHERLDRKLRLAYAETRAMQVAFTDELSAGGLRIRMHHHVEAGVTFVLRLELAGSGDPAPLVVSARCVWCRHEGGHYIAGLEFTNLRPDERERIEAYSHQPVTKP